MSYNSKTSNLTFKLTDNENGALSQAIDKIIEKEHLEKIKNLEWLKNKGV